MNRMNDQAPDQQQEEWFSQDVRLILVGKKFHNSTNPIVEVHPQTVHTRGETGIDDIISECLKTVSDNSCIPPDLLSEISLKIIDK